MPLSKGIKNLGDGHIGRFFYFFIRVKKGHAKAGSQHFA